MQPKTATLIKLSNVLRVCHTDIHQVLHTFEHYPVTQETKIKVASTISKLSNVLAEL